MLYKNTVSQEILTITKELQNNLLFTDFHLAGGTSLALQIGHRTSTDIDLFTYKNVNFYDLGRFFKKNPNKYKIDIEQDGFLRVFVDGIKVELIHDDVGKLISEPKKIDDIRYLDKYEIAPMKIKAITGRTKSRDFIDVAYLLQEISLNDIFSLYKEKYGAVNINILKREMLSKSKMIKNDEWLIGIEMIKNDINIKDIPNIIKQSIEEYNNINGIGKHTNNKKTVII